MAVAAVIASSRRRARPAAFLLTFIIVQWSRRSPSSRTRQSRDSLSVARGLQSPWLETSLSHRIGLSAGRGDEEGLLGPGRIGGAAGDVHLDDGRRPAADRAAAAVAGVVVGGHVQHVVA